MGDLGEIGYYIRVDQINNGFKKKLENNQVVPNYDFSKQGLRTFTVHGRENIK